jgi:two-component system, NarL family, response regulator DevR
MIRVLIVGDHEMYRQVMTLQLETQLDIEVVGVAGSLSEARTRRLEGVDVAILAHVLPDGVGLELIKELRKASPGVKVLVINVLEGLAKSQEALEAGADAVLGNLVTTDRVLATIRRLKGAQSTAIYPST